MDHDFTTVNRDTCVGIVKIIISPYLGIRVSRIPQKVVLEPMKEFQGESPYLVYTFGVHGR